MKELRNYFRTLLFELLEKSFTERLRRIQVNFNAELFKTNLNFFIYSSQILSEEISLILKKVPSQYGKQYFIALEQQNIEDVAFIESKLKTYFFQLLEVQEYIAFIQDYLFLHRDEFLREMKFEKTRFRQYPLLAGYLKANCLAAIEKGTFPSEEIKDRRVYFDTSPAVRYLTYFALLLKLPHSLSMCTAVTIADVSPISKSLGLKRRLLVACNLSSNQKEPISILRDMLSEKMFKLNLIFRAILVFKQNYAYNHLGFIRQLLRHLEEKYPFVSSDDGVIKDEDLLLDEKMVDAERYYRVGAISPMSGFPCQHGFNQTDLSKPVREYITDESCIPIAGFLLSYLIGQHKVFPKKHLLLCATAKIIYALCFDEENKIFSEEQKQVFFNLEQAWLLLPKLKLSNIECVNIIADVHSLGASYQCSTYEMISIRGTHFLNRIKINHVHAEQLLAYFVETVLGIQCDSKSIGVGVSMLCCQTCMTYLSARQIPFYGTHSKIFPDVVNFLEHTLETSAQFSLFKVMSHPALSPFVSRRFHIQ